MPIGMVYSGICLGFHLVWKVGGGGRCHNLKNGNEDSEDTEESPAGCAGEIKQSKGS